MSERLFVRSALSFAVPVEENEARKQTKSERLYHII